MDIIHTQIIFVILIIVKYYSIFIVIFIFGWTISTQGFFIVCVNIIYTKKYIYGSLFSAQDKNEFNWLHILQFWLFPAILSLYLAAMTLYSELQVYVLKLRVINSQRQISMRLYDLNKIWMVR